MIEFDCIRHGESVWNAEGRLQGQSMDEKNCLTEKGRGQVEASAQNLLSRLAGKEVMIWSSPSPRTRETAEIIAQIFKSSHPIVYDKRLMEAFHGSFEGKNDTDAGYHDHPHYAYRKQIKDPQVKFTTPFGPPESGAENGAQVYKRVKEFFDEVAAKYPQCAHIVVTHGGPINHMCKVITGNYGAGEKAEPAGVIRFNYVLSDKTVRLN